MNSMNFPLGRREAPSHISCQEYLVRYGISAKKNPLSDPNRKKYHEGKEHLEYSMPHGFSIREISLFIGCFIAFIPLSIIFFTLLGAALPFLSGSPEFAALHVGIIIASHYAPIKKTSRNRKYLIIAAYISPVLIYGLIDGNRESLFFFSSILLAASPFFVFYLLMNVISPSHGNTDLVFYRETGKISVYDRKKKKREDIPFSDIYGFIKTYNAPNAIGKGDYYYQLLIYDKISDKKIITWPLNAREPGIPIIEWEWLSQFMDKNLPLPDTPELEEARQRDEATLAHDARTGRPKDFWKSMSDEEYRWRAQAAFEAMKEFPFGLSRNQALAEGWKSSEQRWQEEQQLRANDAA